MNFANVSLMWDVGTDNWIIITGILSAMACAVLGNFLLLRRMSMMGDAISHAVLPGLVMAFMITHSRSGMGMLVGAALVGILTALFTQTVHKWGQVEESAAMGVVFTSLFALGLILIRQVDDVDLDPSCVLYGAIELVTGQTWVIASHEIPKAAIVSGGVLIINLIFVIVLFKELRITSFDPALATTMGINSTFMHYALMTLVAVTTVACFEAVGSILVIAMLIVPAAAAHLLTNRLWAMILISMIIAALGAALGHLSAIILPQLVGFRGGTTTAGMMAVAVGAIFLVALLFAPEQGILSKLLTRFKLTLQTVIEDMLGILYRHEEKAEEEPRQGLKLGQIAEQLGETGTGHIWLKIARFAMLRRRLAKLASDGSLLLEMNGRKRAAKLIRSHRLWESYGSLRAQMTDHEQHVAAHALEHLDDAKTQAILEDMIRNDTDPQGKQIPDPE